MTKPVATRSRIEGSRSRIEGTLHRLLPAVITIRSAEGDAAGSDAADTDGPMDLTLSVSSEEPYLRASWWDEPWIEVLGHKASEVELTRLNGGAPVLANHDRYTAVGNTPLAGIGAIKNARLEGSLLKCDITISGRKALSDLRQDIRDDLVRNVSIGYIIDDRVLVKNNGEGQPDEYRVISWTPYEISLVDVPADATVGLGRSAHAETPGETTSTARQPGYRVIDLPPAEGTRTTPNERTRTMGQETTTDTPAAGTTPATPATPAARGHGADPLQQERERVREITAIGRQLGLQKDADTAIESGMTLDNFRALVVNKQVDNGKLRKAEGAEIGMSTREVESYSFTRALLAAADPAHAAKLAPFEVEASRAAQEKRGDSRDKTREAAITIPIDVLRRGISLSGEAAASAARQLMAHNARRDLTVGSSTAGGNLVATELLGSSFIELLRNAMVIDRMGVTWLRDLNGNVAIPSQTGAATAYWVGENGAPTESAQAVGQVVLTPKTVSALTDYSRRLLLQSSIDVEAFVRADLAAIIGLAIQLAAINGSGSSNEPTGLLNTSGIGSVAGGTNGGAPTHDFMVDLETAVGNANADVGKLAYLTNSKVRGKLRKTQEFSSTNGKAVWGRGAERGIGDVLGYDAFVSNSVPSTLTKGSASGVCSAIAFGNWADLIIGMWGGLDVMLDPYANAPSGGKRVIALQDVDVQLRQVASFAAMKDALTT